ncbi:MAG: hypothetical protein M3O84_01255, partial [Actinomycetota bacterium]|nr:hypothetical protein [Actinomycetota bacterium]
MNERRWTARLVVAGVALTMLAAACGSSNSSSSSGGGSSSTSTPSASAAGGGGSSGGAVTVSQANFSFSPSTFTVKSGDTITVKNTTSSTQHTFTITGQTVDVTMDPGTSQ